MEIDAKIVADSVAPNGCRLTTFELTYPRFIHSEVMTHRVFSRNAASSRAIPVKKIIEQVRNDPAMPIYYGKNQPGMQAKEELSKPDIEKAQALIKSGAEMMASLVETLSELNLHKQTANRYLEPWFWMKTILTGTDFSNFFYLRLDPDAQPEFQALANKMYQTMHAQKPLPLKRGQWHLPYINAYEVPTYALENALKCSVARCARVSYLNHDGTQPNRDKDLELHDKLFKQPHASPFEHQATPLWFSWQRSGNFSGWRQYRKTLKHENHTFYGGFDR